MVGTQLWNCPALGQEWCTAPNVLQKTGMSEGQWSVML